MTRPITLVGVALLAAVCSGSAEAQQTGGLGDHYAKEAKAQVSRAKKYKTAPKGQGYMSAPRSRNNYASDDVSGRLDMSGRVPPSYFTLRDQSSPVSRRGYIPTAPRRPASSKSAYPRAAYAPSTSADRPSARDFIPPAPR